VEISRIESFIEQSLSRLEIFTLACYGRCQFNESNV